MRKSMPRAAPRWAAALAALALLLTACGGSATVADSAQPAPADTNESGGPNNFEDSRDEGGADDSDREGPGDLSPDDLEPVPYRPAGRVGDPAALEALLDELSDEVPAGLRTEVPWPDIGHPDPAIAQLQIFDLWIWMAENNPQPELTAVMAADGSPSRDEIAGLFGLMESRNERHTRDAGPYRAFDHRVVTVESAGLPQWLVYDVPDNAVVVYYQDQSGPLTIRDGDTDEVLSVGPAVGARQWLSIMVPTEVGWLLYRDALIEPGDPNLEVPEAPPSFGPGPDRTDV